jgi:Ca2+-binding EF-hand superfamily protein
MSPASIFPSTYRNSGAGTLQIEWGWRPQSQDRQSNTLFQLLDKDKDGSLSRAELLAAQDTLHPFDSNGDDLIQATELPSGYYYPAFRFHSPTNEQPVPVYFPFAVIQPDAPAASLAGAILKHYDHDKHGSLSRTQFQVDKAVFDSLDANHDGRLDATELAGWRKLPPDLEFLISLEQAARKDILLLPGADGKAKRLTALLPPGRDGAVRIPLAEKQLEVTRYQRRAKERDQLLKKFEALAAKDDKLDERRIYQPPFTFVALLRLADRNGDNRLSGKELVDYLDVQEKYLFRTSYLTVVDRGASLFEFLDADHDGRLSPRELRTAWTRLSVWDSEQTGRITRRQVPRQFQLVFSYGQSRAQLPMFEPGFAGLPMVRDLARGPLWFRKMDRNGDGDVSQTEFLGTKEQFRRIDSDGDGLIDANEADRADKEFRKK